MLISIALIASAGLLLAWRSVPRVSIVKMLFVTMVVGYVLGFELWHKDVGPLPLTLDRVLLLIVAGVFGWRALQGKIGETSWIGLDWALGLLLTWLTASCLMNRPGDDIVLPDSPLFRLIVSFWIPAFFYSLLRCEPIDGRSARWLMDRPGFAWRLPWRDRVARDRGSVVARLSEIHRRPDSGLTLRPRPGPGAQLREPRRLPGRCRYVSVVAHPPFLPRDAALLARSHRSHVTRRSPDLYTIDVDRTGRRRVLRRRAPTPPPLASASNGRHGRCGRHAGRCRQRRSSGPEARRLSERLCALSATTRRVCLRLFRYDPRLPRRGSRIRPFLR